MGKAERRWWRLIRFLGGGTQTAAARAAFDELDRRYSEPGRGYHGWAHVLACLRELEGVHCRLADPAAVELALWFHDAVYDPKAQDNEETSARLAAQWAERLGLAEPSVRAVRRLILATRHTPGQEKPAGDEALMADIDLAVFGRPWREYRRYSRRVRREYAGVPQAEYRAGRAAVLEAFLSRPTIYRCAIFRRYERRARRNLRRELRSLTEKPGGHRGTAVPAARRKGSAHRGFPPLPGGRRG